MDLNLIIIKNLIKASLPSILRDLASAAGAWLAATGLRTDSVEHALAGGILLIVGLVLKFVDQVDGPTNIGTKVFDWTIGPRVQDVANSIARWVLVSLTAFLAGLDPTYDWSALPDSSVPSAVFLVITFIAQRFLKTK